MDIMNFRTHELFGIDFINVLIRSILIDLPKCGETHKTHKNVLDTRLRNDMNISIFIYSGKIFFVIKIK